ncbi:MAG: hypothetical protein ACRDNI_02720 [Gaiellaceae bacterium]
MDAPYERLIELCDRLRTGTETGRVIWEADRDAAFAWIGSSGSVTVRSLDADGDEPFELSVFSSSGQKVETLASEWAEDETPAEWNAPLGRLYRAARRQALGVDKILDDLFAELPKVPAERQTA